MSKEIFRVSFDEKTKEYKTKSNNIDGLDELNIIGILADEFRGRITGAKGRIKAEEMLWDACKNKVFFYDSDGEVSMKTR